MASDSSHQRAAGSTRAKSRVLRLAGRAQVGHLGYDRKVAVGPVLGWQGAHLANAGANNRSGRSWTALERVGPELQVSGQIWTTMDRPRPTRNE
jgi:hypothetical protein